MKKSDGALVFKAAASAALLISLLFVFRICSSLKEAPPGGPVAPVSTPGTGSPDTSSLIQLEAEYRNDSYGYSISYPSDWKPVEAVPRNDSDAEWGGAILLENELQKVTFQEQTVGLWPGEFQIRVLANPEELTIDSWTNAFHVLDVSGDDLVTETSMLEVAGRRAGRAVIMLFDHMEVQLAVRSDRGIIALSFADGENANDPLAWEHARLYAAMVESFRAQDP